MGGKHLFAGDRLLGPADSSTLSKSSVSDLLDLGEDDIWSAGTLSSSTGGVWTHRRCGGSWDLSPAKEEAAAVRKSRGGRSVAETAKSAPVSVPGWVRMEASPEEVEEEEEEEEWVPPHEYVARVHGKSAVATSVFEGVGRTLKGRDMSRVRDAVWSRTGFFG